MGLGVVNADAFAKTWTEKEVGKRFSTLNRHTENWTWIVCPQRRCDHYEKIVIKWGDVWFHWNLYSWRTQQLFHWLKSTWLGWRRETETSLPVPLQHISLAPDIWKGDSFNHVVWLGNTEFATQHIHRLEGFDHQCLHNVSSIMWSDWVGSVQVGI